MIVLSKLPNQFSGPCPQTRFVVRGFAQKYLLHQFVQDPAPYSAAADLGVGSANSSSGGTGTRKLLDFDSAGLDPLDLSCAVLQASTPLGGRPRLSARLPAFFKFAMAADPTMKTPVQNSWKSVTRCTNTGATSQRFDDRKEAKAYKKWLENNSKNGMGAIK